MKILITGSNGLLGQKLLHKLRKDYFVELIATSKGSNRVTERSNYTYFDLDDGNELMFMDKIIPDYDINTGNIKFSVKTKRYPESQEVTEKGPFTISNTTEKISMRARGRQARIRVSCDSTGTNWRWGTIRMGLQKDGGR